MTKFMTLHPVEVDDSFLDAFISAPTLAGDAPTDRIEGKPHVAPALTREAAREIVNSYFAVA